MSDSTYQIVKYTLVQRPFPPPALPQLLIVVVEALPVLAELLKAGLVDILEPIDPFCQHARHFHDPAGTVIAS